MADRHTLHISKVPEFKKWLVHDGWEIENPKGEWEEIRARKGKRVFIAYRKKDMKEHLSIADKDEGVVKAFLSRKKRLKKLDIETVIQTLMMENDLMLFDSVTGEFTEYESLNDLNKQCYDSHLIAIKACELQLQTKPPQRDTAIEVTLTQFGDDEDACIYCPSCNHCYCAEDWGDFNYCKNCGQALKIKEEHHANNRKN